MESSCWCEEEDGSPCARPAATVCSEDNTDVNCAAKNCSDSDPEDGLPQCGAWGHNEGERPEQSWEPTGTYQTAINCERKIGFKNVQAKKSWHGTFGFAENCGYVLAPNPLAMNPGDCNYYHEIPDSCEPTDGTCNGCGFTPEEQTAPDTKYLCFSHTATADFFDGSGLGNTSFASMSRSTCVGRHSGVITQTECSDLPSNVAAEFINGVGRNNFRIWTKCDIATMAMATLTGTNSLMGNIFSVPFGVVVGSDLWELEEWEGTFWRDGVAAFTHYSVIEDWPEPGETYHQRLFSGSVSWDVNAGTFSLSFFLPFSEWLSGFFDVTTTIDITVSQTEFHYTETSSGGEDDSAVEIHNDGYLSAPYTAAQVYEDLTALLAIIPLADDALYPWRSDNMTTVAPLVTYNENDPTAPTDGEPCMIDTDNDGVPDSPWVDPTAAIRDESIKGALLPAGYIGFWDFDHITFAYCNDCFNPIWVDYSYGAESAFNRAGDPTDTVIPSNSTQWTDNFTATLFPRSGAWVGMIGETGGFAGINTFGTGQHVASAQKWAELKINRPGIDFTRPCGDDKYLLNENDVRCVAFYAASTLTLDDQVSATGMTTGRAGIFGVAGLSDGHYDIVRINATTFTVNEASWTNATYDGPVGANGIIGPVRFPSAPPCPSSPACKGAKGRGDFIYAGYLFNMRDFQERERVISQYASCNSCASIPTPGGPIRDGDPFQSVTFFSALTQSISYAPACGPQVMCISPNEDAFPNGITYSFVYPGFDAQYGSLWQGQIVQEITDPFWQIPHPPCSECSDGPTWTGCQWSEDDGTCLNDFEDGCDCGETPGRIYYPRRPTVEARYLSGVMGCSPLPNGLDFPIPSGISDVPPPANTGFIPTGCPSITVQTPGDIYTPWTSWIKQAQCACSGGRWAEEYSTNGVTC